jgi:hypothetical protein
LPDKVLVEFLGHSVLLHYLLVLKYTTLSCILQQHYCILFTILLLTVLKIGCTLTSRLRTTAANTEVTMPDDPGTKVAQYKVCARGTNGAFITLPKIWLEDNGITVGDCLDVHRDSFDHLVLVPSKKNAPA